MSEQGSLFRAPSLAEVVNGVDGAGGPSVFGYYVRAAAIAVQLGIGIGYAFKRYVEPEMVSENACRPAPFTLAELETLFPGRF